MSLNASNQPKGGKAPRVKQEEIPLGNYMGRLVQVIDTGIRYKDVWCPVTNKYIAATDKPPVQHIMTTYELLTEFIKDENGNPKEDKPRWISEEWPLYSLEQDLATTTKRYNGIDPTHSKGGDWPELVGAPCQVAIVHKQSGKAKIGGVASAINGIPYPELKNEPKVYTIDQGDNDILKSLPEWLQEHIKAATNWGGEKPAAKAPEEVAPQQAVVQQEEGEDNPY